MKFCKHCGTRIPMEAVFCANCGLPQGSLPAEPVKSAAETAADGVMPEALEEAPAEETAPEAVADEAVEAASEAPVDEAAELASEAAPVAEAAEAALEVSSEPKEE